MRMVIFLMKLHKYGFTMRIKYHIYKKRYGKWSRQLLKGVLLIVLCISIFYFREKFFAEEKHDLDLYAYSYALMDGATGRVLESRDETNPMANASTTKILTCIVALENGRLEDTVTISEHAASQPKVHLGVKAGETYPLKDLLYGLMLESYNDCAVAIAEHIGGSVEGFADMLNKKAEEIGCTDTYFITPNGLDAEDENGFHHSTAQDLCKMMAYCVWESPQKDEFLAITQTRNYEGSTEGKSYAFSNKNAFLDSMKGVLSGKTGYTSKAGYCYVMAFEQENEKYCIALLACGWPNNKNYKWYDTRELLNYGMEYYSNVKIDKISVSEKMQVDGYLQGADFEHLNRSMELCVTAEADSFEVLLGKEENLETETILYTDVELPIRKGQVLGYYNVYLEEIQLCSVPFIAEQDCTIWKLSDIWRVILKKFVVL